MHNQISLASLSKYVGIPYDEKDCYELLQVVFKEMFSYDLDILYQETPDRNSANLLINTQENRFQKVTKPKLGDIILLSIVGVPCHVGMFIDERYFLHTRKNTGSVIERFHNWEKRLVGFYRWQLKQG